VTELETASSDEALQVEREEYLKTISQLKEELEANGDHWRKEISLAVDNVTHTHSLTLFFLSCPPSHLLTFSPFFFFRSRLKSLVG
jgi:hypothetical protein